MIKVLTRLNVNGETYQIWSLNENETRITTRGKSIVVNHNIEKINQAWYDWTMKSLFIQNAFAFLSDNEREFLITGITPEEWDKMFPIDEEGFERE